MTNLFKTKTTAQTTTELAVFGAVVIFMVGVILRQSLQYSNSQNAQFRALRVALLASYQHSEGIAPSYKPEKYKIDGNTSRNSASALIIEDRLSGGSDKYGTIDRLPQITVGSGSFSRHLFQKVSGRFGYENETEYNNLPVIDMFINNKHFVFTTAGFKEVDLSNSNDRQWDVECANLIGSSPASYIPCRRLFTVNTNFIGNKDWCNTDDPDTTAANASLQFTDFPWRTCATTDNNGVVTFKNLTADQRFDLDLTYQLNPPVAATSEVTGDLRRNFAWQWKAVMAYDESTDKFQKEWGSTSQVAQLNFAEGINLDTGKNLSVNVDDDPDDERILDYESDLIRVITKVFVLDNQEGDLNFSADPPPGLTNDLNLYTFVTPAGTKAGGTYLQIEDGKLYQTTGDQKQYIRSVQKKDSIDLIERVIRLSNDTHRFCDASGNVVSSDPAQDVGYYNITHSPCTHLGWCGSSLPNPVEACNNCFEPENEARTCMDTKNLVIYVRSRVQDLSGRKWVTDKSTDDYIDLKTQ